MRRLVVLLTVALFLASSASPSVARASPLSPLSSLSSVDDSFADGDLDREDLAPRLSTRHAVAPSARGGQSWIALTGFVRETRAGREEVGGMIVVGLALDRIVRGSNRSLADPKAPAPPPAPAPAPPPAPPPSPPAPPPPPPKELVVVPRVARACVAAAWRAASIGADDARIDAIVARAHWSALLPETRLRAMRWDDETLSADATTTSTRLYDDAVARLGFEARLTWRLDRLLYAEDEPSFERIRLERQDARARLAAHALDALFRWQRAILDRRLAPGDPELAIRVVELEATLDVTTGGWFGAWRATVLPAPLPDKGE